MRIRNSVMAAPSRVFRLVIILFLILLVSTSVFGAQNSRADPDLDPLRPADTSSPRATLQSFVTNLNKVIEGWRAVAITPAGYRAYRRAVQTLDFSTTPSGDTWSVRTRRILLLKEILDRIEVPPDNEIPGDREVADGAITQWTIPNTRISIVRSNDGPRAGEFLFSATTVERLSRVYQQVKQLSYRPGATYPGLYEEWARSDRTVAANSSRVRNRLKPVDTSNPLSTLEGFMDSVNRAYALVMEADAALKATPPIMTKKEALEIEITAGNLLERAISALDLSQVPEAYREDVGMESALLLKEVLDRMLPPPLDSIPNAKMVEAAQQGQSGIFKQSGGPLRWRIPNTDIEIVEIKQGERQGQFLFSAGTVGRIGEFYKEIQDLPYQQIESGGTELEYLSPDRSPGFYEYYISTPGYLVPRANFLGAVFDNLPPWFKTLRAGQTRWQWIGLLLCLLAVLLAAYYVVFPFVRLLARRVQSPLDNWVRVLVPATILVIVIVVQEFIDNDLNITGDLLATVTGGGKAIVTAMIAWGGFLLCKAVAETIIASPRIPEGSLDASLLRISAVVVGFLLGAWIVIGGLRGLGADVLPLLAGLGIGGLAVALAAQSTIANFIGSLILFINRPVRVGDFCCYGGQIGTVEQIGLYSTRIRSLERSVVSVPNAEFSQMKLENLQRRDRRLLRIVLQLRYETTPEQMRYVLAKLRELLLSHPKVTPDPARVRYTGYGAYSKDLEIFAYLRCRDQNTFLAIQEDILLRMEDIINEAGTGFAFPSQTAYLSRDIGLNAERKSEAEGQVEQWRDNGNLPFPEFDSEERDRLNDILDYPPKGSPGYKPPQR